MLQDHPEGARWRAAIASRVVEILPALRPLLKASSQDEYTLIGGDSLIEANGKAKLIELNMYPCLCIEGTRAAQFNRQVSQPMLKDVAATVLLENSSTEF